MQSGISKEVLRTLDPISADRLLPAIVEELGSRDTEVAALSEEIVSRHPLFAFRKGWWPTVETTESVQLEFFSQIQITKISRTLTRLAKSATGPVRMRLVATYARFPGLDNLVDVRSLAWNEEERDHFHQLVLRRSLMEFRPQMTIALSYQCNQRCPYCFSDAFTQRHSGPISWEHFLQVLAWGRRAGVSRVAVTGGEPTLHPEFQRIMAELRARNLTTYFSSNGCVPRAAFECLSSDFVETVTFHILDDEAYLPGQLDHLEENIRCVRDKGIPLVLRYVLTGRRPPQRYLDLAARYRPGLLTFSPVFPGPHRRDMSHDVRTMFQVKDDLLGLVEAAVQLGIRPAIAKPVPLCMFSRDELLQLAAAATLRNICDVSQNQYTNNTLVNPDLSMQPCMALPLAGGRLDVTSRFGEFSARSRQTVEPLLQRPMLLECRACQLFRMRLCQAACLAFALPPA